MARRTNRLAWWLVVLLAAALAGGASLVRSRPGASEHLDSALIAAARKGDVTRVKQLLTAGARVNALVSGHTALEEAIQARRADLVDLLLKHGANASAPCAAGTYPTVTPLDLAVFEDRADIIKLLLAHGARVDERQPESGWTVLIFAAWHGRLAAVRALLARGADPNARDAWGRTALYHAAYEGHTGIVRTLIAHGAVINPKDRVRWTPLMGAVGGGRPEVVKLLLALGADVNGKGYGKDRTYTALTLARSAAKNAREHPSTSKSFPWLHPSNYVVIIRLLRQAGARD